MKASEKKQEMAPFSRKDALECRPVKNPEAVAIRMEGGEMLISYPVTIRPWVGRLLRRLGKNGHLTQTRKLQLDGMGAAVWEMMNGILTVRQVSDKFAKQYQLHNREAEVAVACFIRDLGKRGLIALR